MLNSTIHGVINSNSFRNSGKVKVLLHVLCAEAISVLQMEEKVMSIDTGTPQSMMDMLILHNDKENGPILVQSQPSNLD